MAELKPMAVKVGGQQRGESVKDFLAKSNVKQGLIKQALE